MELKLGLHSNIDCADISLIVTVDGQKIFNSTALQQEQIIHCTLLEYPSTHRVAIELVGKQPQHTIVDDRGNIVSDVYASVSTLEIQGIDVKPIFCAGRCCYFHSYNNPDSPTIVDEFYGDIGCNGTVNIDFFTPIYLWLADYF